MAATLTDPVVPLGSLVLVTGVNGLIASHAADTLLASGYRVRGTVRDLARSAWLDKYFRPKYGPDALELVQVADICAPGVWANVVKGVSGIVSVAAVADLHVADVDKVVGQDLGSYTGLLEAARDEPSVRSVVITGSIWAAWTPAANVPAEVGPDSWNEQAVRRSEDPSLAGPERGIVGYMAARTRVEKALWAWVGREAPRYKFNTVSPGTVLGPILSPGDQPASTAGLVRWLWNGEHLDALQLIPPQWFIDARDCARLFLGALALPGVDRRRVLGAAERFSWPRILDIMKQSYPDRTDFVDLPDAGWDQTNIADGTATGLLRALGREWTTLEQSVRDAVDSFRTQ